MEKRHIVGLSSLRCEGAERPEPVSFIKLDFDSHSRTCLKSQPFFLNLPSSTLQVYKSRPTEYQNLSTRFHIPHLLCKLIADTQNHVPFLSSHKISLQNGSQRPLSSCNWTRWHFRPRFHLFRFDWQEYRRLNHANQLQSSRHTLSPLNDPNCTRHLETLHHTHKNTFTPRQDFDMAFFFVNRKEEQTRDHDGEEVEAVGQER